MSERPLKIAIIAGEVSGDVLGASLIAALKDRVPNIELTGVTGPRMRAAGCESLAEIDALSLFGISEVISEIPRLLKLRKQLVQQITDWGADLCIGIDAPSFNLGLEKRLKAAGIKTAHYVSPTVWAWRAGRIHGIAESVDLMLTLFPFEQAIYDQHNIPSVCVGHPLADHFPMQPDQAAAKAALGLDPKRQWLAMLPGSRGAEVNLLSQPFVETARWLAKRLPELGFVVPLANEKAQQRFRQELEQYDDLPQISLLDGESEAAMTAADVVLLASGTAALEACLLKRPMVVAYRVAPFSYFIFRKIGMLKVQYVSLPNHLTAEPLVPEFIQHQCTAENLAPALYRLLKRPHERDRQVSAFLAVHEDLRRDASQQAADALLQLVGHGG
ncbi:MAG: lipid-A-disaccharide synthase [Nevskiales bacterium]